MVDPWVLAFTLLIVLVALVLAAVLFLQGILSILRSIESFDENPFRARRDIDQE